MEYFITKTPSGSTCQVAQKFEAPSLQEAKLRMKSLYNELLAEQSELAGEPVPILGADRWREGFDHFECARSTYQLCPADQVPFYLREGWVPLA